MLLAACIECSSLYYLCYVDGATLPVYNPPRMSPSPAETITRPPSQPSREDTIKVSGMLVCMYETEPLLREHSGLV